MSDVTTIQIKKETAGSLKGTRLYSRETYDEIINRLIEMYNKLERKNQYDEFLHLIQQKKMKELWDNEEDEEWENA